MEIGKLLSDFNQITLEQAHVDIPNRNDQKFVIPVNNLPALLLNFQNEFDVLSFKGNPLLTYETTYYDTQSRRFYHEHHNGIRPRTKVRIRKYLSSGDKFLELKLKTNRSVTYKIRKSIENGLASSELTSFVNEYLTLEGEELFSVITNTFHRIFLVKKDKSMRMTIDVDLAVCGDDQLYKPMFSELAILEIKANKEDLAGHYSHFKRFGIVATRFSKYCLGLLLLEPGLKHNDFNPTLRRLSSLCK